MERNPLGIDPFLHQSKQNHPDVPSSNDAVNVVPQAKGNRCHESCRQFASTLRSNGLLAGSVEVMGITGVSPSMDRQCYFGQCKNVREGH